ncbi:oxygenase MpaB family protein [Nocardiopsis mangrovi]|uniref:Oxygenase MpaB family protein n=1 Tax=Nocardiopsis mangrovi TaxID=1179818 RepID=A0ABV9E538_9ACTN
MANGLFTDDTQIRRVTREAVILAGAGYAILLQVTNPGVGQGVADHSDFAERPLDRLRGTLTFIYGMVFGTTDEAERIARGVRSAHKGVTGPGYDARDPSLQVWVAATLCEGGIRTYELVFGPMSPREKDDFCAQCAVYATSLGCPADRWPADRAAFERYWADEVASIEVTDTARSIARALFDPPQRLIRPAARLQGFLAAGLLPPRIRDELGLPWDPARQRRYDRLVAAVRAVYPRLPMAVRSLPKNAFMWDIRRRAARSAGNARGTRGAARRGPSATRN